MGQTADLVPADRMLYSLRDVTGTVPSIPLISASIMSKKLAEGADALVLDVKWGRGAFMKTLAEARELARTMVEIGKRMRRGMTAVLTDMNQPLGRTAGNALEIRETVEALEGNGPADLMAITLELGGHMLMLAGRETDLSPARERLRAHIASGAARERFAAMVRLHGGDASVLDHLDRLPSARIRRELTAPHSGYVGAADADGIGRACLVLGAGRSRVEDAVDPAVGVSGLVKIGERVERGQPLLILHANDEPRAAEAMRLLEAGFTIQEQPATPPALIGEVIR
jgi:pyrimidine-nucleoside phosphorylase